MLKEVIQTIQARNWALANCNAFSNPYIYINVSDWSDNYVFLVNDVPQRYHLVELPRWFSRVDVIEDIKYVIFDKDVQDTKPQNLYLHQFNDQYMIYYCLYDEECNRALDSCVMFNKTNGEVFGIGYAPGRCPDKIEQFEV